MVENIEMMAEDYCIKYGLPVVRGMDYSRVRCDDLTGVRIAKAYQAGPVVQPSALPAYRALREETLYQLDQLARVLDIVVVRNDPYADATELLADLREGRLRVWSTAAGNNPHPVLGDDDNDAFRAVHDGFGHGCTERGFDKHGEEAAWVKHSQMYSSLARQALATETRGQTCMFWYGNRGKFFSAQKAFVLPREFWASHIME